MPLDFRISTSELKSLRTGSVISAEPAAIFRIEGPGALTCLQGLLTSDLALPGDGSLVYGALLTPKGMIVVDPWVLRETTRFTLVLSSQAREAAAQLFDKVLPPRLAKVTDLSGEWSVAWLFGSSALERFARANATPLPGPGRVLPLGGESGCLLAAGLPTAPFAALVVGPVTELDQLCERAERAGFSRGEAAALAAARVLGGWPTLGREIDDRTLPQEVRFDELGAVSYVKGCYTGQETVARVHFRGHVNRTLRGLRLAGASPPSERTLVADDKEVGSIRTALVLDDRVLALATVRREIAEGAVLQAGDRKATVVALPFEPG
jgi:folate-binding protein YgfZ